MRRNERPLNHSTSGEATSHSVAQSLPPFLVATGRREIDREGVREKEREREREEREREREREIPLPSEDLHPMALYPCCRL